jgi:hypothetical protein
LRSVLRTGERVKLSTRQCSRSEQPLCWHAQYSLLRMIQNDAVSWIYTLIPIYTMFIVVIARSFLICG